MDDAQLLRYSRHILLQELGIDAQEKFAAARVLIVGAGGLGAPAAQFLASAGVGTITLCDPDAVDLTNLQRQILFATSDVGARKVDAAKARLTAVNPDVRIETVPARVGPADLAPLVARADVVLDCSDNFATRHAVNRACVAAHKPLVSGAAIRFDGQVAVFDTRVEKVRRLPGSAAKRAAKVLRAHGFEVVDRPTSFYVADVQGPTVPGEFDRAHAWGTRLFELVQRQRDRDAS